MSALVAALKLAGHGLRVFPCAGNKSPRLDHWPEQASADPRTVRRMWWRAGFLVGVPTGATNGYDVLDIDPKRGGHIWLEDSALDLNEHCWNRTQSRGFHVLFRHDPRAINSIDRIAPGIEVLSTGRRYHIWWPAQGMQVSGQRRLGLWPEWLLRLMPPPPVIVREPPVIRNGDRYAAEALASACAHIAGAVAGEQENILTSEAYSIGLKVAAGRIDRDLATWRLVQAGTSMNKNIGDLRDPWTEREVRRQVERKFRDAGAR